MRINLIVCISILTVCFSPLSFAEQLSAYELPEKIKLYMDKKYPASKNVTIARRQHFGVPLYRVTFNHELLDKNNNGYDETAVKYFRMNGGFYSNAMVVHPDAFNILTKPARKTLEQNYPGYKIVSFSLLSNPNSIGEEYEFELDVAGRQVELSMKDNGEIISEINPTEEGI